MLNLSRIDLATVEDKQYHIDYWASLFKATTWEEIKMLDETKQRAEAAELKVAELLAELAALKNN